MAQDIELKIKAAVEAAEAAKSVGELRRSIRELESIAIEAGDANQEAFLKATEAAGAFSDKIEDTKRAINTFKGDTIATLSGGLGTLKRDLVNLDFRRFNEEVGRLAITAKGLSFAEFTKSIKGTTTAFAQLGKVLLTNPIFLLATAVIGIVLAIRGVLKEFGLLQSVIEAVTAPLRILKDLILDTIGSIFGLTRATEDDTSATIDNTAERRRQEKALDDQKKAVDKLREAQERLADEQGRTKQEKLQEEIDATTERIDELRSTIRSLTDTELSGGEEFLSAELKNKLALARTELETLVNENQTRELQITKIQETENKNREDNLKKSYDKRKNIENRITDFLKKSQLDRELNALDTLEREKKQLELQFAEQIRLAGNNVELRVKLEEEFKRRKEEIDKRISDNILEQQNQLKERLRTDSLTERERELEALQTFYDSQVELAAGNQDLLLLLQEEFRKKEKEINDKYVEDKRLTNEEILRLEQSLQDAQTDILFAGLDVLKAVGGQNESIAKAAFFIEKAQAAGSIISGSIATATKLAGILAIQSAIPNPVGIAAAKKGILANKISTAAALASLAATSFSQLKSSAGPQPSTIDLGGGGGGAAPTPTFSPGQFFGLGQQTGPNEGQVPEDTRVFVVESDITSTQNRVSVIESRSTIG